MTIETTAELVLSRFEEVLSRFEEGKPADPTENMSPEDAKTWREQTDEHKDEFKAAAKKPSRPSVEETPEEKRFTREREQVEEALSALREGIADRFPIPEDRRHPPEAREVLNHYLLADRLQHKAFMQSVGGNSDEPSVQREMFSLLAKAEAEIKKAKRLLAEVPSEKKAAASSVVTRFLTADQDKAAPEQVDKYFEQVKKDNPSYDDSQAYATAWSIYCKHKNPGSDSCHQDEYLTGKTAGDRYLEAAWKAPAINQALAKLIAKKVDRHFVSDLLNEKLSGRSWETKLKEAIGKAVAPTQMRDQVEAQPAIKKWLADLSDSELSKIRDLVEETLNHGKAEQYKSKPEAWKTADAKTAGDRYLEAAWKAPAINQALAKLIAKKVDRHFVSDLLNEKLSGRSWETKLKEAIGKAVAPTQMRDQVEAQPAIKKWLADLSDSELSKIRDLVEETLNHGKAEQYKSKPEAWKTADAKTAGFGYGVATLTVLFVEGRKPVPFNIDTIQDINHITIPIIGDDGEEHDVQLKVVRHQSSGPLTQPQEKLGWKREVLVEIQHPVDEGGSPQTSARAALTALAQVGKQHGFRVEPVQRGYKPETRKQAAEDTIAAKKPSNPADRHQHKILVDTVKNPLKGKFLGGPSAEEAEETLREKFKYTDAEIQRLKQATT